MKKKPEQLVEYRDSVSICCHQVNFLVDGNYDEETQEKVRQQVRLTAKEQINKGVDFGKVTFLNIENGKISHGFWFVRR